MKKTIRVDALARVEGEGALRLDVEDGVVRHVELRIFEPPRYFEAFLVGRMFTEAPDITARICGICPVAYQMSSVHALENALGVTLSDEVKALRRLLYCGEWIESHTLHVAMLHLPDFLGIHDAVELAKKEPALVKTALALKRAGNEIVRVIGGREVHPINVRVGGFYRSPSREQMAALAGVLESVQDAAQTLLDAVAALEFPDFERDYTFVSLVDDKQYPFIDGRVVVSDGRSFDAVDFETHVIEHQVPHSMALQASLAPDARHYHVGPLARFALNHTRLPDVAKAAAARVGLTAPVKNPFRSIVVRAVELIFAVDEALRLARAYVPPDDTPPVFDVRKSRGAAATEAPRGILFHRYALNDDGTIAEARIVPPTSQNQATIEDDLRAFATDRLALDDQTLTWQCEQAIRNYDPCISCATHFLKLERVGA
jgi:sulfhydrogenase subunit alpha